MTAAAAIASMVFFILMQRAGGGADYGEEMLQRYAPCGIYVLLALFSLAVAALSRRRLRLDKAARTAAKSDPPKGGQTPEPGGAQAENSEQKEMA